MNRKTREQRQIAAIHVLKAKAGLDEDTYRRMLREIGGVDSSKKLTPLGRAKVLAHLRRLTQPPIGEHGTRSYPGRPHTTDQRPMLRKIEAILADARRPWSYAESLARRMAKKERLEFCTDAELHKIVAAMMIDQTRRKTHAE
ncbi:MAG TPA: regulatory protein GemA [Methylococcus sp.]|nr:regulatory protein GemA [Methylococcus sp.]